MNYLAHAYLSFNQPEILVGNMISDFVKGKAKFNYSPEILKGIMLHRDIDTFTDNHPATTAAKQVFRETYRLYAGAFIDVVYDHFLANDSKEFASENMLEVFTHQTYIDLQNYKNILPDKFAKMLPYMKQQNWLFNYRYKWGIQKSFEGLVRRATYLTESEIAFSIFEKNYAMLQQHYSAFFPALKKFVMEHPAMNK